MCENVTGAARRKAGIGAGPLACPASRAAASARRTAWSAWPSYSAPAKNLQRRRYPQGAPATPPGALFWPCPKRGGYRAELLGRAVPAHHRDALVAPFTGGRTVEPIRPVARSKGAPVRPLNSSALPAE